MSALARPSVLVGRLAALGLLVAVAIAAVAAVALPVAEAYRGYDSSIANLRGQIARYDAMAAMRTPLDARLARLEGQRPGADDLVGGAGAAVAGARLQDLIKRYVAEGGGAFVSAQGLAPEGEASFERIGVRVQFNTTVDGLVRTLHAIESSRPLLFVEALEVRGRPVRKGQEFDRTQTVPLNVTIDVAGFRRKEKA